MQAKRSAAAAGLIGTRVLVAKPGLDGHDRGAKVIARLLRDEGCEVIYTGIRQRPAMIARAAIDENVAAIGLSVLSGAHLSLTRAVMEALAAEGGDDIKVVVGGTIPDADIPRLRELGVAAVFGVGSSLDDISCWFRQNFA
jgi:methylmalonyl-CoA mutase C-terminal domain/subunit